MKPGGTVALCQELRVATSDLRAPGAARSIRFPGVTSWAVGWGSMGEVLWRLVELGALVLVEVGGLGERQPPDFQRLAHGFALKR